MGRTLKMTNIPSDYGWYSMWGCFYKTTCDASKLVPVTYRNIFCKFPCMDMLYLYGYGYSLMFGQCNFNKANQMHKESLRA